MLMDLICAIPEEIGWAIVGFVACLCIMVAVDVVKTIVRIVRERKAENDFWAVRHCEESDEE